MFLCLHGCKHHYNINKMNIFNKNSSNTVTTKDTFVCSNELNLLPSPVFFLLYMRQTRCTQGIKGHKVNQSYPLNILYCCYGYQHQTEAPLSRTCMPAGLINTICLVCLFCFTWLAMWVTNLFII